MPNIIICCGIPTSGKSSWSKKQKDYEILSRDDIREFLYGKSYKQNKNDEKKVDREFWWSFQELTWNDRNIIIDNTNVKLSYINEIINRIPEGYTYKIKYFSIPLWKANIRNIIRKWKTGKWIPFKVMRRFYKQYKHLKKQS